MNRIVAARAIAATLSPSDVVVCSLGSVNRSWRTVEAPQATYFCSDPMGISVSIALGLALACEGRRVVALCGDGDLAMGLSSLATVAGTAAARLHIVVFNNRRYETGGGQPLASPNLCFETVARGVGMRHAATVEHEADLPAALAALFAADASGLLAVAIDAEPLGYSPPADISQAEERALFMRRLAETRP